MALTSKTTAMFFYLISLTSFLLIISMADGRLFDGFVKASTPECESVFGVGSGDTCFSVTQLFNLTTEFFDGINPNLNCDKLFVGQWLCVAGTV